MTTFKVLVTAALAGLVFLSVYAYAGAQEWRCTSGGNVWSAYDPNERNPLEYKCYTFDSVKEKRPVRAW